MKTALPNKPSTSLVSVKLEQSDRERLNSLAVSKKRSAHYLMKEAIQEYIKREEIRMNFIRAGEASAQHYKDTGLHISFDELSTWVDAVQTNPDAAMPVCHK